MTHLRKAQKAHQAATRDLNRASRRHSIKAVRIANMVTEGQAIEQQELVEYRLLTANLDIVREREDDAMVHLDRALWAEEAAQEQAFELRYNR